MTTDRKLQLFQEWMSSVIPEHRTLFIWNESNPDDRVFQSIEDVADLFESPLEMARAVYFGEIDSWGNWVRFNSYGNLETVPFSELCSWIDSRVMEYTEQNLPEEWAEFETWLEDNYADELEGENDE